MKLSTMGLLCVLTIGVAGCGLSVAQQSRKVEQDWAASCRRSDADVEKAAHPDAATIARHDRLIQKAADLNATAAAQHLQGTALDAAIATIAQVHIEAEALYDVPGKQQIANQCWAMLGVVPGRAKTAGGEVSSGGGYLRFRLQEPGVIQPLW